MVARSLLNASNFREDKLLKVTKHLRPKALAPTGCKKDNNEIRPKAWEQNEGWKNPFLRFEENGEDNDNKKSNDRLDHDSPVSIKSIPQKQKDQLDRNHETRFSHVRENEEDEDSEMEDDVDRQSEEEGEGEDIVESSRRLLRMASQRIQFQEHSDEIKKLRETMTSMEEQMGALKQKLRCAVEAKRNLVLEQTDFEAKKEQTLFDKDKELNDLEAELQRVLEKSRTAETCFMEEITSLTEQLNTREARHKRLMAEKDLEIAQLQKKASKRAFV